MDDILILEDEEGSRVILTTNSPLSVHGIPVLRIEADDIGGDYRAMDRIDATGTGEAVIPVAGMVVNWARHPGRTAEELEIAKMFLRQWPEGPQV